MALSNDPLAKVAPEFAARNAPLAKLPAEFATLDGVFAFKKAACAYAFDRLKISSNEYVLVTLVCLLTPITMVLAVFVVGLPCGSADIFTVDIDYPNRIVVSSSVVIESPSSVASSGIYAVPFGPYILIWLDVGVLLATKVLFTERYELAAEDRLLVR